MRIKVLRLLAFFFVLFAFSVNAQTKNLKTSDKEQKTVEIKGYPVAPFKDTLFLVYHNVGSFSAKERAEYISNKIKRLYNESFFE